jgi:hypothetical protein
VIPAALLFILQRLVCASLLISTRAAFLSPTGSELNYLVTLFEDAKGKPSLYYTLSLSQRDIHSLALSSAGRALWEQEEDCGVDVMMICKRQAYRRVLEFIWI